MLKMLDQEIEHVSFSVNQMVSISEQAFVLLVVPEFYICRMNNYASGILQFYIFIVLYQFSIGFLVTVLFSISP